MVTPVSAGRIDSATYMLDRLSRKKSIDLNGGNHWLDETKSNPIELFRGTSVGIFQSGTLTFLESIRLTPPSTFLFIRVLLKLVFTSNTPPKLIRLGANMSRKRKSYALSLLISQGRKLLIAVSGGGMSGFFEHSAKYSSKRASGSRPFFADAVEHFYEIAADVNPAPCVLNRAW